LLRIVRSDERSATRVGGDGAEKVSTKLHLRVQIGHVIIGVERVDVDVGESGAVKRAVQLVHNPSRHVAADRLGRQAAGRIERDASADHDQRLARHRRGEK
jgi:hypothetical protein